ncbi:MAG: prepilin-type N-terminal cleavage/methylation domain-containing protein [Burkholderiaceae bacterium]|nr:prepilin-type N-terminal cleavage/methylation domain-containing protein [Burkholderiaceae bacterium]
MSSASVPTASPAAKGRTPTSGRGSRPRQAAARGFTLIELMVVVALIAIAVGLVSLSLRDPAAAQLDREAVRLAALLETARAESRASGVALRFELPSQPGDSGFRFVGAVGGEPLPSRWLADGVSAEIIGGRTLTLGPEPLIGPQRIVLRLGERNLTLATDGIGPFAAVP